MQFSDRRDAGRQLANRLLHCKQENPVVLALPRGGVPVGFEIAGALAAPLDLVLVRKIGAPFHQELAVGAVADGEDPLLVTDAGIVADMSISADYLERARLSALGEIERRRHTYVGDCPPVEVAGRTVIVVDDGIATGATMLAAVRATRRRKTGRIVLAVPVAAKRALSQLCLEVDETVCLGSPENFVAVGNFYRRFPQLRDEEVLSLLDQARGFAASIEPGDSRG
jgi:putative phosphoribosyl transferase